MPKLSSYKSTLKKYFRHRTFRNIGFLTIGQGLAQVVSLVGAFYIPRLLGPEKYGIYQTVIAYVGMFTVFTFSGLNKVILRESSRNLDKIKEILEATVGLKHLFSLFAIIISTVIALFIDYEKGTKLYISLFSFSLWFKAMESTFNVVYQANEKMKYIAILSFIKPLMIVPLSILFLHLGYGVSTLIIINLTITGLAVLINYFISKKFIVFTVFSKIKLIKSYLTQGFNFSLISFLNMLSTKIDIFMLSILTTPEKVGIYALAFRIVQKGLLIRRPISTALFPYYTKRNNKNTLSTRELIKHSFLIIVPSLILIGIVLLTSEWIITTVVGNKYIQSASILNVLIFYLILNYLLIPWGLYLQTNYNERIVINISMIVAIINIILNIVLFYKFGLIGIAYSTLITYLINVFLNIYFVYKSK